MPQRVTRWGWPIPLVGRACLLALLVCGTSTQARPPTYGSELEGKDKTIVRVFEQATKKTIWRRTFPNLEGARPSDVSWAKDHRAIAIAVGNTHRSGFHIVLWRAGERVRIIYHRGFTEYDGVEKMLWSSDDRALIVVYYMSGMWDMDTGVLSCIDADRRRVYDLPETELGLNRVQWVGLHTIRYWAYEEVEDAHEVRFVPKSKPSTWRLPGRP